MDPQQITVSCGDGRYRINIYAVVTTNGLSLTVMGGEEPHVGGVVMSLPRKSLRGGETLSCDTFVSPAPGHKDTGVAVPIAEMVSRETGHVTAVVAGIHIEKAVSWEIEKIMENSMEAARQLVVKIKEIGE